MEPKWLDWARRLHGLAQNGLMFAKNPFDIERYQAIRKISAEMLSAAWGLELDKVEDLCNQEAGYQTPKIDVRGVAFRDDSILLVKERSDQGWTLPGGWAEIGISPAENVVKEVFEESGFHARVVKVLGVYDRRKQAGLRPHPHHLYRIFFLCTLTGGDPTNSIETDGVGFFPEDRIPKLSAGRVTPEIIGRMFEHYRHPEWMPDFD